LDNDAALMALGEIVAELDGSVGKGDPSQALVTIMAVIAAAVSSLLQIMSIS
jgi:hypothetical protein